MKWDELPLSDLSLYIKLPDHCDMYMKANAQGNVSVLEIKKMMRDPEGWPLDGRLQGGSAPYLRKVCIWGLQNSLFQALFTT